MIKELYLREIASRLELKQWQVENCVDLFEEGATIPFVSRYRKERTGGLDEVAVAQVKHWAEEFADMEKRKQSIVETIEKQGALTEELSKAIEQCVDASALEDIYLPYRPKRRTRASVAREAGLEPLALAMAAMTLKDPALEARKYLSDKITSVDDALAGARDIIAEQISEKAVIREALRDIFMTRRIISRKTKEAEGSRDADKYRSYFAFSIPLQRIASHQLLALLRAADEGFLRLEIDADPDACCRKIFYEFSKGLPFASQGLRQQLDMAVEDSYKRLLEPSISGEVIKICKRKADVEAVRIFGENLRQLLMAPPVGGKRTMAIDPGFRTGCKVVCLDAQGNLLYNEAIFPHPPANSKVQAIASLTMMLEKYTPEVIAVGSGTAGRETVEFLKKVPMSPDIKVYSVSEDGASIYSASDIARQEFPEYDLTVRGAVSIGRRLMDPLAELVKIDPKSLGVGQYQHDVDQNLLKEKLDNTVESCVSNVGVELNTASPWLLTRVSGLGPVLADNIVQWRKENGRFESRKDLMKVKRLGDKAFQQCAGFLRISGAANPLDNSAVHPETYSIVDRMASDLGVSVIALVSNKELCDKIDASRYVSEGFGLPTVNDIISELRKPSRDPRSAAQEFSFAQDIREIEDLHIGMEIPGIVNNITAFGAFVDIGLHEHGLIHVSQMGVKGLADPSKVLHLHQTVNVRVISVDLERRRIGLSLIK